jgi:hypothetical protein
MRPRSVTQKFGVFFIAMLGVSGVGFGLHRVYRSLYAPFQGVERVAVSFSELERKSEINSIEYTLSLYNTDSDQDGINDYDELNTYNTSPYLKDTDSDGADDKTELEGGDDPICPKGKTCGAPAFNILPQDGDLLNELPLTGVPGAESQGQPPQLPDVSNLGSVGADELRLLLEQSGFSKEQLDAFSDEELLDVWNNVTGGG